MFLFNRSAPARLRYPQQLPPIVDGLSHPTYFIIDYSLFRCQLPVFICVIVQRKCHPLIEKGKCHPYEKRGDIEQQGTEKFTDNE